MVHHISKKLGKGFQDVTDDDIRNHGLLCIMQDEIGPQDASKKKGIFPTVDRRGEEDHYGSEPRGAEPDDYYSVSRKPDKFVKGAALLRLLQRYGKWPRSWGEPGHKDRNKLFRGRILAKAVADVNKYPLLPDLQGMIKDRATMDMKKFPLR